jgi:Cyclic nucleotide-binding domain/TLC ATP/ADP transporter
MLLALHNVSVIAVTIAGKSVRDGYFLSRFDKSVLPLMMCAIAVAVAIAVPVYTKVASRYRSEVLLPGTALVFAVSLFLIHFKLEGWTIPLLYVWTEVITVITVLQFWLLASDVFDVRQAKRLFPMIGGGGSFAAILVGLQLKPFTKAYGSDMLLWLVCGLLLALCAVSVVTTRLPRAPVSPSPRQAPTKPGRKPFGPYLRVIALLVVSASVVATVIDYQFKILSSSALRVEGDLIGFFGQFYAITGLSTLLLQFVFARPLLNRFGIDIALLVLPLSLGFSSIAILVWPVLASAVLGKFADQTFRFTLHNGGMELLWLPVSRQQRRDAKPVINGTLKSAAEGLSGIGMFMLVKFMAVAQLSYVAAGFTGLWMFTLARLRKLYVKELQAALEKQQLPPEDLEISAQDAVTVAVIDRAMAGGDPMQQLFALDLIKDVPLEPWADTLRRLLSEGAPEVRARILEVAAEDPSIVTEHYLQHAIDARGATAVQAIRIVGRLGLARLSAMLNRAADDTDPAIRAASYASLLRLDGRNSHEPSQQLSQMMVSSDPAERAAALEESVSIQGLVTSDLIIAGLGDSAIAVRGRALAVAAQLPDERYVPLIVECLRHPNLRLGARRALAAFPASRVLAALAAALERQSPLDERRAIVRALRTCPVPQAYPVLLGLMHAHQPSISGEASDGLLWVSRGGSPPDAYRTFVKDRWKMLARTAYGLTQALHLLPNSQSTGLLRDYLENSLRQILPALIRLAALGRPEVPVETCIQIFLAEDRARLPYVLELLDAILPPAERQQIASFLEPISLEARAATGRKYFPDMPAKIEEWLQSAIHSGNDWLSAIALEYSLETSALGVASIDWNRVSPSPLILETVLACARRRPALAATIATKYVVPQAQEARQMLSTLEKTILLKSVSLFKEISAEDLSYVATIAEDMEAAAGTLIFREGDFGDCLYVIVGGSIRIHKGARELAVLGRMQAFGEMAVLDGAPRSASATALEDTTLMKVGREQFLDVMRSSPEIMQGIVRLLLARLREADERLSAP